MPTITDSIDLYCPIWHTEGLFKVKLTRPTAISYETKNTDELNIVNSIYFGINYHLKIEEGMVAERKRYKYGLETLYGFINSQVSLYIDSY